jgi:hypothetical protein
MVSRHLTVPYEFVCLTDDTTPIDGVRLIVQPNANYNRGWWHKVHMFDPALGIKNKILYFDLDVVIHNNIDKLITDNNGFYGIRDFNRKFNSSWNQLNSSALSWTGGQEIDVWTKFKEDCNSVIRRFPGDQDWIWFVSKDRIKFWNDQWIMSYKWEIRDRSELNVNKGKRNFVDVKDPIIPQDCCVTVFHGDPKPQDVKDQFVIDNWR